MAEKQNLEINFEKLNEGIVTIQDLKTEVDDISIENDDDTGSGSSIDEIGSGINSLANVQQSVSILIGKTIDYLNGVLATEQEADQKNSDKINKVKG